MLITFRYSDDFIIYFSVSEQSVRLSNKRKAAKLTPTSSYNGTGLQMNWLGNESLYLLMSAENQKCVSDVLQLWC